MPQLRGFGVAFSFPMFRSLFKKPVVRRRSDHPISRKDIAPEALSVLYRLTNAGYTAYLVGGGVRDLMLGRKPKDFDVATDAYPRQIKSLFRSAFLIGRRFRLALIRTGDKQIETSTFRRDPEAPHGMTPDSDSDAPGALYQSDDNCYGTPEQDAMRRDFTVNGLFYDISTFSVIDYVGGLKDIERKVLRCIGDPKIRFREDPVRMMRAIRFSAKLGFKIHRDSEKAITEYSEEILQASPPRLFEEIQKLFGQGATAEAFRLLWTLGVMKHLLPDLHDFIQRNGKAKCRLWPLLDALDLIEGSKESPDGAGPALHIATLLYPMFATEVERNPLLLSSMEQREAFAHDMVDTVFCQQFVVKAWRPPKAICYDAASILAVQPALDGKDERFRRQRAMMRPWYEQAAMLFEARAECGDADSSLRDSIVRGIDEYKRRHASDRSRKYSFEDGRADARAESGDSRERRDFTETDAADQQAGGGRRKRRRGGRTRRKRSPGAAQPADVQPQNPQADAQGQHSQAEAQPQDPRPRAHHQGRKRKRGAKRVRDAQPRQDAQQTHDAQSKQDVHSSQESN